MIRFSRFRKWIYRSAARRLSLIYLIPAILISAAMLGACQYFPKPFEPLPHITDPSFSTRPSDNSTSAAEPTPSATIRPTEPTAGIPARTTAQTTTTASQVLSFDEHVARLLLAGLQNGSRSIEIGEAIRNANLPESEVQQTVDRVFSIYQQIFAQYPEFFYLNGSIKLSYQIDSSRGRLVTMTIKPDYWPEMTDLRPEELDALALKIQNRVNQVASDIAARHREPWQQLAAVQDYLSRHIAYDETLDQNNNHLYSALFRQLSLCQGYAQSFQMIAGQLGFEVRLITGEADGVGHAWNLVRLDGKWYHVDVTFDDPTPDRGPDAPLQYVHFMRSDAVMKESHTWKAAEYPSSTEDGAYYYRQLALTAASREELNARFINFINTIDLSQPQTTRLQLLFTGQETPGRDGLEEMVRDALRRETSGYTIYFSSQVIKRIVLIDITPAG